MDPYWLGMALLVILCLASPVGRRIAHARALRSLKVEGVTVVPGFWRLGHIRISRVRWEAEVRFGLPGEFGGGQRGHLKWSARVGTLTPSLRFHVPGPEADAAEGSLLRIGDPKFEPLYVIKGDQTFGVRLMVQATRDLLVKMAGVDGRIWTIHEGTVEITGPFMTNSRALGEFLELSAQILDRIATAALPAEAPR